MSTILNISLKGPVAQDVADLRKYVDEFSKKKEGAEAPASPSKSGMALTINLGGGGEAAASSGAERAPGA